MPTTDAGDSDKSLVIESNHPGTKQIPPYFIGKKKPPQQLPYLNLEETDSTLLNNKFNLNLLLIGSWTPFNKKTSDVKLPKSVLQYLPVIPAPPECDVL